MNDNAAVKEVELPKTIVFSNKGVIDVRAITILGVNAKEGDNPIGQFGTGLKYAIAVLLRNGHAITIYAGSEQLKFTARTEIIRGKEFGIVYMNDERLGFTTDLGKNWGIWQAFRELYSNCIDEHGSMHELQGHEVLFGHSDNETVIIVEGDEFYNISTNISDVFIDTDPDINTNYVGVYEANHDCKHIYYKNIRISDYEKPWMYKYNIKSRLTLTEDRTAAYQFQIDRAIVEAVAESTDKKWIEEVLTAPDTYQESTLDFSDLGKGHNCSEEFLEVLSDLRWRNATVTKSASTWYEDRMSTKELVVIYKPEESYLMQLDMRLDHLEKLGFPFTQTFSFVRTLKDGAKCMIEDGVIYISKSFFDMEEQEQLNLLLRQSVTMECVDEKITPTDILMAHVFRLGSILLNNKDRSDTTIQLEIETDVKIDVSNADNDNKKWLLQAEWSGYKSNQRKIVHKEYITDKEFARLQHLETYQFGDMTTLDITFSEVDPNKELVDEQLSYSTLIRQAAKTGDSFVTHKEIE